MGESESRMNLKALQKIDPYIVSIVASSGQVALYKFEQEKDAWEKTEIEGTLFVYQREAHPKYGFTIMNRLSLDNLVEVVTKELDFQLKPPFLLYRNNLGHINGIWFYVQKECAAVSKKIEALVKEIENSTTKKQGGGGGGGLGQLFKSAESELNGIKKTSSTEADTEGAHNSDASGANLLRLLSQQDRQKTSPSPIKESTSAVVLDFFAKASSTTQSSSPHLPNSTSAFTTVPPVPVSAPPSVTTPTPMGRPLPGMQQYPDMVHRQASLDQASIPPLTAMTAMTAMPISQGSVLDPMLASLMTNPGIHSVESIEAEQRRSDSVMSSSSPKVNTGVSALELQMKNGLNMGDSSHLFTPLTQAPDNSEVVTLLSPQVFSSRPNTNGTSPTARHNVQKRQNGGSHSFPASPLTPGQMVEALTYLLETDSQFVHKLHEAYVLALNKKLQDKH